MRVIDARSGHEVKIGQTIDWGDGESITLLDVDPGIFSASAIVRITHRDESNAVYARDDRYGVDPTGRIEALRVVKPGPLVTITRELKLRVRWLHPAFRFQHVAFIPS